MSHLEDLLCEYLMWKRHLVLRNERVGKLDHGGHAGELDIVAYSPQRNLILHVEPSLDSDNWKKREVRYTKKFAAGRKHIASLFPWLNPVPSIRQVGIFPSVAKDKKTMAGGELLTVDEVIHEIKEQICSQGKVSTGAISEQFPLLRTIQMPECGYYRKRDNSRAALITFGDGSAKQYKASRHVPAAIDV